MFNFFPGHGLGFSGSHELAFGLGPVLVSEVSVPSSDGGGSRRKRNPFLRFVNVFDNAYSVRHDDDEVVEILSILFEVIE